MPRRKPDEIQQCIYCGVLLTRQNTQMDHAPIPQRLGGVDTVPACLGCHDMKDRFLPDQWPDAWKKASWCWDRLPRESRIWLVKVAEMSFDMAEKREPGFIERHKEKVAKLYGPF